MKKFTALILLVILAFTSCAIKAKVKIKEPGTYFFEENPGTVVVDQGNVTFWQSVIPSMIVKKSVDSAEPIYFDNVKVNDLMMESGVNIYISQRTYLVKVGVTAEEGFTVNNDGTGFIGCLTLASGVKSAEVTGKVEDLIIDGSEMELTVKNADIGNIIINGSNNKVHISDATTVENMDIVGSTNKYYLSDDSEIKAFSTAVLHELDI